MTKNDLEKLKREHRKRVEKAFKRAKRGKIIDLTALQISQERIIKKELKRRKMPKKRKIKVIIKKKKK
jgi:hypothetical protein